MKPPEDEHADRTDFIGAAVLVTVEGNFLLSESGSHARFAETIDWLLRKGVRLYVYGFSNHPTAPWTEEHIQKFGVLYPSATLVLDKFSGVADLFYRFKNLLLELFPTEAKTSKDLATAGLGETKRK
jgi:hypothetical protein